LGQPLGEILPVFHFHDVTREALEPYLQYLKQNDYRTVTSEAMRRFAYDGIHPGRKSVVLCFDDAFASMWTVATPLLERYGMSAITYVIPARVSDAAEVRDPAGWAPGDEGDLATWPEIKAMHMSGRVDVQAHTLTHANIFCSDDVVAFVTPETCMTMLGRPVLGFGQPPRVLNSDTLGAPLYLARSRMSDALAYVDTELARDACVEHVDAHGGSTFFEQTGWRQELKEIVVRHRGRFESVAEREQSQLSELQGAREMLEQHLPGHSVRHVCFPWGVAGESAVAAARRAGYETAVADQLWGRRCMWRKTDPYHIMRLKHSYIFTLPGRGRKPLYPFAKRS
jgi:peptidoglycan/xylan/chitin deacetylase (PgdA/CDA1 family)